MAENSRVSWKRRRLQESKEARPATVWLEQVPRELRGPGRALTCADRRAVGKNGEDRTELNITEVAGSAQRQICELCKED